MTIKNKNVANNKAMNVLNLVFAIVVILEFLIIKPLTMLDTLIMIIPCILYTWNYWEFRSTTAQIVLLQQQLDQHKTAQQESIARKE